MYSVFVGMCSGGDVRAETMTSLISAYDLLKEKGIGVMFSIQIGGYTAHNRNTIVQHAKEVNATHLMFIDADQTFPPSGILRLLDNDKDIVGANYNSRSLPTKEDQVKMTVHMKDKKSGEPYIPASTPDQLFKCYGVATGFMLIKMKVFDKLEKPYFVAWETEEGEHRTEDIDFCRKAGEAGIRVWCNPSIKVGHIGLAIT